MTQKTTQDYKNDFHFEVAVVVVMVAMTTTMMIVSHLTGPLDGVS